MAARITRRHALELGGAGLLGLTLPNLLRAEATASVGQRAAKAKNVIFYWCQGGPPHQDMWDLKPEAPAEVRGEFKGIDTVLPGYQVCELMPELAKRVNKLSIVRGVNHHIPDHNPGSMFMLGSGNAPNPTTFHPSWSAVCKKEFPETPGLPTAVAIPADPGEGPGAGFLGAAYTSFAVTGDPSEEDFKVRSLALPTGVDLARLNRRQALLSDTNRMFDGLRDHRPDVLAGLDKFAHDAYDIILSDRTKQAFRIEDEPAKVRDRFGRTKLGQRMLLARRLVQSGVRFVTIGEPDGWDTHNDNFVRCRKQIPNVDQGLSALLDDLEQHDLLDDTLVMMFGEFGRTPKINAKAGRDHWPQAMSIILAGGGVPKGLVYGTTDKDAGYVVDKNHSPADFACTVYSLLGIDPHKHYPANNGQPTPIVRGGEPIKALIG